MQFIDIMPQELVIPLIFTAGLPILMYFLTAIPDSEVPYSGRNDYTRFRYQFNIKHTFVAWYFFGILPFQNAYSSLFFSLTVLHNMVTLYWVYIMTFVVPKQVEQGKRMRFIHFAVLSYKFVINAIKYRKEQLVPQSGDYAKSKQTARVTRARAVATRNLKKVDERFRAAKRSDKLNYEAAKAATIAQKKRYEPHAGFNYQPWLTFMSENIIGPGWFYQGLINAFINWFFFSFPRVFRFSFTVVNFSRPFMEVFSIFRNIVRVPLLREMELLRSIPVHMSSMNAAIINSKMLSDMMTCDSNNIEKWTALFVGLFTSKSLANAASLIFLHFKCYYNESVSTGLVTYFLKIMGNDDDYEPQSMESIVSFFKMGLKDWNNLRSSKLFLKVTDVMALIVSSGMCKMIGLDFSLQGIPLFSENLRKRIQSANIIDVTQMLLESVTYFIEIGYMCFQRGSLRPILFNDAEAYEFDEKLLLYLRQVPMACDGDWTAAKTDYESFTTLYSELNAYLKSMVAAVRQNSIEKKILWDKLTMVNRLWDDFDRRHNAGVMRCAPFVLCFCGPSAIGKTSVGSTANMVAVIASGGDGDQMKKVVWNENDEYFSNYKADTDTIVMDDMCNTKAAFMKESPLSWLIKFNNNTPELAVIAELEKKGKLPIRPRSLLLTTNVPDLLADVYSNEPVSIMRRIDLRVSVKVKPAFAKTGGGGSLMLDPELARAYCSTLPAEERQFPDMWFMTAEVCQSRKNPSQGLPDVVEFVPVYCEKKKALLVDATFAEICDYVAFAAYSHRQTQEKLVASQAVAHKEIHICPTCHYLRHRCDCPVVMDDQAGEDDPVVVGISNEERLVYIPPDDIPDFEFEDAPVGNHPIWSDYVEPFFRELFSFRFVIWAIQRSGSVFVVHLPWLLHWTLGMGSVVHTGYLAFAIAYSYIHYLKLCFYFGMNLIILRQRWRNRVARVYAQPVGRTFRDVVRTAAPIMGQIILIKILIDTIRSVCLMMRTTHQVMQEHSALQPTAEEYTERRRSVNPWITKIPKTNLKDVHPHVKTTAWKDLFALTHKNSVFVKHGSRIVGGFFVKTHCLLLPKHFCQDEMELDIIPSPQEQGNSHAYRTRVSCRPGDYIEGTDLCLVYCAGGTERKDLTAYFPTEQLKGEQVCSFVFRQMSGELLTDTARLRYSRVATVSDSYDGAYYDFRNTPTFKGMCMGVFTAETKQPYIAGFHLGGMTGTRSGCSGTLYSSQLALALGQLESTPGFSTLAESGPIPTTMFEAHLGGESFMLRDDVAPRCPTNYLPDGAVLEVFGTCKGAVTNQTQVMVSHISDTVAEVFEHPRTHGPPMMKRPEVEPWFYWALALEGFSTPAVGPFPSAVESAVKDFESSLDQIPMEGIRPLDMETIINGLDGDKFLNRMPQNTSVGFPLQGKLEKFCTAREPTTEHALNMELDPDIIESYRQVKQLYLSGQRVYSVFRGSLKDEPVKIGKKKVRVFQAAPVVQKMILREFFLPIAAQMSMFPLLSECAVGINAFGPEWQEMMEKVEIFGSERVIAGDYSSYDQRMPAILTTAAFDIMMRMARRAGYSDEDLRIMRSAITDVVYPMLALNGTLMKLGGSNPSGHNLTVYVNSIVNSLISRMAFLSVYPLRKYTDCVSSMTYGDDDIGTVCPTCPLFNNVTKANFVVSIGMLYTPPSKEGSHVDYLSLHEVDFLKRKDTFNAELGYRVGVLEEDSVFKSLQVRSSSKVISDEEWAASVVDGALHEFFPRGRAYYEDKRSKLGHIAHLHNFYHHTHVLDKTYEEMVEKYSH